MPGFGRWQLRAVVLAVVGAASCSVQASAQSLEAALAYAYANNPQLNAQRAQVRATDENVPTALAGYRPRVSITANAGTQSLSTTIREIGSTTPPGAAASYFTQSGVNAPRGAGATVTQNVLNGFQTANRTRQAEAQVFAARETLRNIEQTVLLNAATAYMNLLRDAGILELQRSNVEVLQEQLRQSKQRLEQGNVTQTDVSQSEARLAVGRTQLFAAEAAYETSKGTVFQSTVHTVGGVLTAGDAMMLIVPEADSLTVEAKVNPQDIDQVRDGLPALLRFSAFNQRTTPEIYGKVSRISADASTDQRTGQTYYTVRIALPADEVAKLGEVRIVPGMPVETFIQTGDRTMISYLTKPLHDNLMRMFREK